MKTLKPLKEIKNTHNLNVRECSSYLRYFKQQKIDFDVFLPSIGKNLQRDFVWNIEQKREMINSVLLGRHIPHVSYINTIERINGESTGEEVWQIIDGKQRLSSIFDFVDDKFTIILEGEEFLFSELPEDYKQAIMHFHIRTYEVIEYYDKPVQDSEKIAWFKSINFAGTPQDVEHMNSLK